MTTYSPHCLRCKRAWPCHEASCTSQTPEGRDEALVAPATQRGEAPPASPAKPKKPSPPMRIALRELAAAGGHRPYVEIHATVLKGLLARKLVIINGGEAALTQAGWSASKHVRRIG